MSWLYHCSSQKAKILQCSNMGFLWLIPCRQQLDPLCSLSAIPLSTGLILILLQWLHSFFYFMSQFATGLKDASFFFPLNQEKWVYGSWPRCYLNKQGFTIFPFDTMIQSFLALLPLRMLSHILKSSKQKWLPKQPLGFMQRDNMACWQNKLASVSVLNNALSTAVNPKLWKGFPQPVLA